MKLRKTVARMALPLIAWISDDGEHLATPPRTIPGRKGDTKVFARLVMVAAIWVCPWVAGEAAGYQPLDARQKVIANAIIDDIVKRITALKPKYPELAKFGESPWFTRGAGDFRYDYKIDKTELTNETKGRAEPGGLGVYCEISALGEPTNDWYGYYDSATFGGSLAGITRALAVTTYKKSDQDDTITPVNQAIRVAEEEGWNGVGARLSSEYLLAEKGVVLATPALLDAAENPDTETSLEATTALGFRELTPDQLARFRRSILDGKIARGDGEVVMSFVERQDPDALASLSNDLVALSLQSEMTGKDTFKSTPFTGRPWMSEARMLRQVVIARLKTGDPRCLEPAETVLTTDPDRDNREQALNYIATQPEAAAQKQLVDALLNSFRSIQVEAAEDCGDQKLMAAEANLRILLQSPAPRVREAAMAALKQLGRPLPHSLRVPPLPDSARQIAAVLWENGLKDDDLWVIHALPWPDAHYFPTLTLNNLKKVAPGYLSPKDKIELPWKQVHPPGPFMLAAAIRGKDDDFAGQVYSRMCDVYDTDNTALTDGLDSLGWDRFCEALDDFHQHRDDAAGPKLDEVIALARWAKPFTRLDGYIKQSRELSNYIKTRPPEKGGPSPSREDTVPYLSYWIGQLKQCDGVTPSPAGEEITAIGPQALPMLVDALSDKTPTRNYDYGRSYLPERGFVYVGDAAKNLIGVILDEFDLHPINQTAFANLPTSDLQAKLRPWLKSISVDARRVKTPEDDRRREFPAGRYFWGDD